MSLFRVDIYSLGFSWNDASCHIRTIPLIDNAHIYQNHILFLKRSLGWTMMRNSGIFSKSHNRWKTLTTGTELKLENLNSTSYRFLCNSYLEKGLNRIEDGSINSLTFTKFLDFFGGFDYSLLGNRTRCHSKLWTVSLNLLTKCLSEIIRINIEYLILR